MNSKTQYLNDDPTEKPRHIQTRDETKAEFASRLQHHILAKGLNQSEFARLVQNHMPEGKNFGRDKVSHYVRGRTFPSATSLRAMSEALGVHPTDLIPTKGISSANEELVPRLQVQDIDHDTVWLKVNRRLSRGAALKVQQIIYEDDQRNK